MEIIKKEDYKVEVKSWCPDIEESALKQVDNLARLPFVFKHVAIMGDVHMGFGMPIGGVVALKDVISPAMVGVDIGCGMCAVKTSLTDIDTETLKKIMGKIRKQIPVGFEHQKERLQMYSDLMPEHNDGDFFDMPVVDREWDKATSQIGTLGGGNHFIEIQKGSDSHIWIMIHSGSRNLGKQVADHYNKVAIELNKKWHSDVPEEWELAFLPVDSEEGQAYIREMNYCVEFALANRELIMERIQKIFATYFVDEDGYGPIPGIEFDPIINIAHNYASKEKHFGKEVWVHRKGATLATKDTIGIIPGSQGTSSYIVKGKANRDSFNSCSHGAGRKMGRKEAERRLNLEEEIKLLDDQGILHAIRGVGQLDEATGAYKDIQTVMKNQEDLVEILIKLTPLGVIKG